MNFVDAIALSESTGLSPATAGRALPIIVPAITVSPPGKLSNAAEVHGRIRRQSSASDGERTPDRGPTGPENISGNPSPTRPAVRAARSTHATKRSPDLSTSPIGPFPGGSYDGFEDAATQIRAVVIVFAESLAHQDHASLENCVSELTTFMSQLSVVNDDDRAAAEYYLTIMRSVLANGVGAIEHAQIVVDQQVAAASHAANTATARRRQK
jgi:hypothetical protein